MQRRRSERIPLNLPTKVILSGKPYDGTIVNVSEDGIGSAVTSVIEAPDEFVPVNDIRLHFQDPSGKAIDLDCELTWFSRSEDDSRKIIIGMKIIKPPLMYKVFIKKLYDANLKEKSKEQLIADLLEARRKISDLESKAAELRQEGGETKHQDAFRSLVESTEDSIYIVDRECRYQFVNQRHLSRMHRSSGECIGRPYGDFHSSWEADELAGKVNEVFEMGASVCYQQQSSIDGEYFLRTLSPIVGPDNTVEAVTVISKNITDRKLAEELLLNSQKELEKQVRDRTSALIELNEKLNREIAERRQTEEAFKKSSEQ